MKSISIPHLRKSTTTIRLLAAVLCFLAGLSSYYANLSYCYDATALAGEKFCVAHGAVMRKKRVPIAYGMHATPVGYDEVRAELFPNARRVFRGGCVRGKKTHVTALVCDSCRAVRLEWLKEKGFLVGESRYGEPLDSR